MRFWRKLHSYVLYVNPTSFERKSHKELEKQWLPALILPQAQGCLVSHPSTRQWFSRRSRRNGRGRLLPNSSPAVRDRVAGGRHTIATFRPNELGAVGLGKLAAYEPGSSSRAQVAPARYSEQAVEGAHTLIILCETYNNNKSNETN